MAAEVSPSRGWRFWVKFSVPGNLAWRRSGDGRHRSRASLDCTPDHGRWLLFHPVLCCRAHPGVARPANERLGFDRPSLTPNPALVGIPDHRESPGDVPF